MGKGKKALVVLSVLIIAYWLFTNPSGMAETIRSGVSKLGDGGDNLITFFDSLFGCSVGLYWD